MYSYLFIKNVSITFTLSSLNCLLAIHLESRETYVYAEYLTLYLMIYKNKKIYRVSISFLKKKFLSLTNISVFYLPFFTGIT
jgi:hypothetical protein